MGANGIRDVLPKANSQNEGDLMTQETRGARRDICQWLKLRGSDAYVLHDSFALELRETHCEMDPFR